MENDFCNYLEFLYKDYLDNYGNKCFYVHDSAYEADYLAFWEYGDYIHVSDASDYYMIIDEIEYRNSKFKAFENIPNLIYETDDKDKIDSVIDALNEEEFIDQIKLLYYIFSNGKSLSLRIDN